MGCYQGINSCIQRLVQTQTPRDKGQITAIRPHQIIPQTRLRLHGGYHALAQERGIVSRVDSDTTNDILPIGRRRGGEMTFRRPLLDYRGAFFHEFVALFAGTDALDSAASASRTHGLDLVALLRC